MLPTQTTGVTQVGDERTSPSPLSNFTADEDTKPAIAHTAYASSLSVEFATKTSQSRSRTGCDCDYEIDDAPALTLCSGNSNTDSSELSSREVEGVYFFNELPYDTETGDALDEAILDNIDIGPTAPDWVVNPHPNELRSLTEAQLTLKNFLDGDHIAYPTIVLGDWLNDYTDQHLLWVLWEARTVAGIEIHPNIDGKRSKKRKRMVVVHRE